MTGDELRDAARRWAELDPDPDDRARVRAALDRDDATQLRQWMTATPLTFGTAGLRGPLQPGPGGMNRANVRFATRAVISWMGERGLDVARGVVVGRDARRHSEEFNDEVVSQLLLAGVRVYEMPRPLPTPLVAYCVKSLGAVAGIMITASHNPPDDNGYKLYADDGSQIVPPDDEIVERYLREEIAGAPAFSHEVVPARSGTQHSFIEESVFDEYRAHLVERFGADGESRLAITYTPLHGVGGDTMMRLFAEAGFVRVSRVTSQFEPDGTFPTLAFPNPEEPGALDLAVSSAEETGSSIIIANDPDADRLGAAVRTGTNWRVLRGDEIGWLLASALVDGASARHETVATTIVSSTLLDKMARRAGCRFVTTLTGFKWIARAAGDGVLGFGYEEALGFAVDARVADKDGMSAALALVKLAHDLETAGSTLLERLEEIEETYGVHLTSQLSIRAQDPEELARLRQRVEDLSRRPPDSLGECPVSGSSDLAEGFRGLPPTEGVWLQLGALGRVVVRPSGTEAKVKAYVEVTPPRTGALEDQRARANDLRAGIEASLSGLLGG